MADAPWPAALDEFLASVEIRALRIAELSTQQRDDALDLVQDAMLRFTRRYAARPPDEWTPLFWRVLQNRIHDWRRQRIRTYRLFQRTTPADGESGRGQTAAIDQIEAPQAHGAEFFQRAEAMRHLEAALRDLPRRQREAFELRVWEGLDVAGTAKAMGCSAGSVKTHLSRALHVLRQRLQGVWP